jgi:hypothetical protein
MDVSLAEAPGYRFDCNYDNLIIKTPLVSLGVIIRYLRLKFVTPYGTFYAVLEGLGLKAIYGVTNFGYAFLWTGDL